MTKEELEGFNAIRRARERQKMLEQRARAIKAAVYAVFGIILVLLILGMSEQKEREYTEGTYTVMTGDTLWSIAEEYCPSDMDKRDYIDKLRADNSVGSVIHAGDILNIRMYDKE